MWSDFLIKLIAVFGSLSALIIGILAWNKDKFKIKIDNDTIKRKEVSDILQKLYDDLQAEMRAQKLEHQEEIRSIRLQHKEELGARDTEIAGLRTQVYNLTESLRKYEQVDARVELSRNQLHHDVDTSIDTIKKDNKNK